MLQTQFHQSLNGHQIAYIHHSGSKPGVLFLPGFRSDMRGSKAEAVAHYCLAHDVEFASLDYIAHGESGGVFDNFTISKALDDVSDIITYVLKHSAVIIGSSMGGWLMLLAALRHPERVSGLIGIAAAPDFTERLMFEKFNPEQHRALREEGVVYEPSEYSHEDYPITQALIEDGRKHLLLDDTIRLNMPAHFIHGQCDTDVPWQFSLIAAEKMLSNEVAITLIKDGEHRLSRPQDIQCLLGATEQMLRLTNPEAAR